MTKQQILERAVAKAKANGWKKPEGVMIEAAVNGWNAPHIIYDHGFAKALWGEEQAPTNIYKTKTTILSDRRPLTELSTFPAWQYHLQQMVIADDPLKYLNENI